MEFIERFTQLAYVERACITESGFTGSYNAEAERKDKSMQEQALTA